MDTPLSAVMGKAVYSSHPLFASFELTYACNLHCFYCYNPVQRKGQPNREAPSEGGQKPLAYEEIVSLLDQLKDLGVLYFTMTGGEPLLHPRFWDIAWEAKKRTFAIRVFTNATAIDEGVADRLAELAPYCLEVSMHGSNDATAEALNKVQGSYQRFLKALGLLRDRGLRVYLKCPLTKLVENQMFEMKEIADTFGFPLYFDPVLTFSDDGMDYPLQLHASDEAIRTLYSSGGFNVGNTPFEKAAGDLNCTVATGTLHITPYGDVQPCIQWKESVGNIRNQPLREIWERAPVMEYARQVNRQMVGILKEKTQDHSFCSHCPGLSKLRFGDPTQPEPQYLRAARIKREAFEADAEERQEPTSGA